MRENGAELGVVAIGRNEGKRLEACLNSLLNDRFSVVYVDSGSNDGSVAFARSQGVEVVELDMAIAFSAARARNEGFRRLTQRNDAVRFVQFLDGDCILVEDWIRKALAFLEAHDDFAVVCGRRRERFPRDSIYNRMIDLEWDTPIGESMACGGDSLVRTDAFSQVGGFNPTVVAGEEPEFCSRLREVGWRVMRLDAEMTLHDAAMTRFSQWWKRAVRGGYGGMDVNTRSKAQPTVFSKQLRGARLWSIGYLALAILALWLTWTFFGRAAVAVTAILLLSVLVIQATRIAMNVRRKVGNVKFAFIYGAFMVLDKWANLQGQCQYLLDRQLGRNMEIIEYKTPARATD